MCYLKIRKKIKRHYHLYCRYLFGGGIGTMTMDELQVLEKNLEMWIYHIRSMKVPTNTSYDKHYLRITFYVGYEMNITITHMNELQMNIMLQEIQALKNKVSIFFFKSSPFTLFQSNGLC